MESEVYSILVPRLVYPLNNIIFAASVYTTITISYERYRVSQLKWMLKNKFLSSL